MPYFDKKRKKWKGVVKKEGQRRIRYSNKDRSENLGSAKRKELENPKQEKTETDMDLLTLPTSILTFASSGFLRQLMEKKKLCQDLLKRWGNLGIMKLPPSWS